MAINDSTCFISIDGNNITLKTATIDESKVETIFQETLDIITNCKDGLKNTEGDLFFAGGRTAGTLSIGESEILASKQISYNAGPIVAQKVFFKAGQSIGITTSCLHFDRVFFNTGSVITFYVPKEHRTGLDSITWQPSSENRSERQYDMFLDGFLDFENKIAENFMCHHTGAISFNFLRES